MSAAGPARTPPARARRACRALAAWCALGILPGVAFAGVARQTQDVLRWGLEEWRALSPEAQKALLEGFTAGAAWRQAGGATAGERVEDAARRLRAAGRLTFHARPNVYVVRLADYWFWENHRPHRLARALLEVQASFSPRGNAAARAAGDGASPARSAAAGGDAPAGEDSPPPFSVAGTRYLGWAAESRHAFAAGFVLGAATRQALEEAGPELLERSLDRLRAERRLALPLPPGAYAKALERFYRAPGNEGRGALEAFGAVAVDG